MKGAFRVVGYCTRCGGDSFDDGRRHVHRCPPARPEAGAVIGAKDAIDKVLAIINRRPWASTMHVDDLADLKAALPALRGALDVAYPGDSKGEAS
ncbi:MAG TPA: hypothetical protein VIU44_07765 [Gaiellaceae bacterium]